MVSSCLSFILLSIVLVDHSWVFICPREPLVSNPFVSPNSTQSSRRSLVWMRFHQPARIQSQSFHSFLTFLPRCCASPFLPSFLPSLTHPSILLRRFKRSVWTRSQAISTKAASLAHCSPVYLALPVRGALSFGVSGISGVSKGSGMSNGSPSWYLRKVSSKRIGLRGLPRSRFSRTSNDY